MSGTVSHIRPTIKFYQNVYVCIKVALWSQSSNILYGNIFRVALLAEMNYRIKQQLGPTFFVGEQSSVLRPIFFSLQKVKAQKDSLWSPMNTELQ